jgi:hypothetical protein
MPISLNCDDSYDDEFEEHENIKIFPFVGEGYYSAKPKIMVLGESPHWDKDGKLQETSRNNLIGYCESIREDGSTPRWAHATGFRNTAAMITGKGFKESDEKWYDMAFYNFYQFIIGINSKDKSKVTPERIIISKKAFFDVIKILSPDFIIVWGLSYMYGSWLPQEGRILLDKGKKLYKYEMFPNTVIWHIQHPSSSHQKFDLEYWQEEYKAVKMFLN